MFKCHYCKTPVPPGEGVCKHKRCRTLDAQQQTNAKCREFGMPPYYQVPRAFPGGGP